MRYGVLKRHRVIAERTGGATVDDTHMHVHRQRHAVTVHSQCQFRSSDTHGVTCMVVEVPALLLLAWVAFEARFPVRKVLRVAGAAFSSRPHRCRTSYGSIRIGLFHTKKRVEDNLETGQCYPAIAKFPR
jgi:hypothetical protein